MRVRVVARLPQRLMSMFFEIFPLLHRPGAFMDVTYTKNIFFIMLILAFVAYSAAASLNWHFFPDFRALCMDQGNYNNIGLPIVQIIEIEVLF